MIEITQHKKPDGDVEKSETHHNETHHGTRTECHLQSAVKALAGCIGSAGGSVSGSLHAKEACQSREESSREECKRHPWILHLQHVCHKGKHHCEYDENYGHHLILLAQISHGSLSHKLRNLNHSRSTLVLLPHLAEEVACHCQSHHRGYGHKPKHNWNVHRSIMF